MRIPYTKPYLPLGEQMELLRGRGMHIDDPVRAVNCLHRIGYYRLSGYWFRFRHQEIRIDNKGETFRHVGEIFRAGTCFEDVMDLYVFD